MERIIFLLFTVNLVLFHVGKEFSGGNICLLRAKSIGVKGGELLINVGDVSGDMVSMTSTNLKIIHKS